MAEKGKLKPNKHTAEGAKIIKAKEKHQKAMKHAQKEAKHESHSQQIAELEETPLSYLPGNAVRIAAKVVGDLAL